MMQRIFLFAICCFFAIQTTNANSTNQDKLSRKERRELKKQKRLEKEATFKVDNIETRVDSIAEQTNSVVIETNSKEQTNLHVRNITINSNNDTIAAYFDAKFDSLYNSWLIQHTYDPSFFRGESKRGVTKAVDYPDSLYISRLQNIDSYVDLSFNKTVKSVIELYTQRRPSTAEAVLGLSTYYFPMIEETFNKYGLPQELKYMAIIESALNSSVRSHAGAKGLWQFMYRTGKMYGLEIDTYVDERCDPIKATDAAARFLADLYRIYGDWHLAIAAYNCGAGNVNKAIRRAGSKRDYWHVYYYLPRETRGYVPAFIAAAYFMNYYKDHDLSPKLPDFPLTTDTVMVNNYLNFEQISKVLNISTDEIKALNPQYIINIIPARPNNEYALCLPTEKIDDFLQLEDSVYSYKRESYFPNNEIKKPQGYSGGVHVSGKDKLQYTVKSGDVIGAIAERFHVKVSDLRYWNNIRGNLIRVGQKLTIYVSSGTASKYTNNSHTKLISSNSSSGSGASGKVTTGNGWVYYTVKSGDNLWSIARRFPGISAQNIMTVNGMKSNNIKVGQKLKIKKQ
ncbi:MAG: LysM peptidoglycan-binding domain-containing protein [Mangrovibacterium sp.]